MTKKSLPSPRLLRQTFRYEPDTGRLIWRKRNRNLTGLEAGGVDSGHGYRRVRVCGRLELAHRVIIAMETGAWPENQVDHINGVRDDNRICNLREATMSQNLRNKQIYKSNKSGCPGVHWHKQHGKWYAGLQINGKSVFIGLFTDLSAAISARKSAEKEHGFHKNHGRKL